MGVRSGNLTLDELNGLIDKREIDTVIARLPRHAGPSGRQAGVGAAVPG